AGARLVIHENFRFQPWHRTAKRFIDDGQLGDIFESVFYLRPGDGRGPHAYLDRQPAFQTMPRLLIYETGVHFVDLFRWLFGPIKDVYADLRRLNPAIRGEDAGQVMFTHSSGVRTTFNGNRLSDHISDDTRRTMGIMVTEGTGGSLRLYGTGNLSHRRFGAFDWTDLPTVTPVDRASFGGGCVAALIDHVVASCLTGAPFENEARDYLPVVRVTEAIYQSHETGQRLAVDG
ncbi:MAG: Gfo/Idh/MocA family oxidoreductase, partial [Pseudomonadota bacterium]